MKKIPQETLVSMDRHAGEYPFRVELAYARPDNLLFGERIYREGAGLWLYKDLADIIFEASKLCYQRYGHTMIVYDGLRTTDAQARMLETRRVKENPHWLEEPRLLSPPGAGGHPRAMAVDVSLQDEHGNLLDMGTPFDYLAEDAGPLRNPAHRQHPKLSREVQKNRSVLNDAMGEAAKNLGIPLFPLPQEWWDFRLPQVFYEQFAPLSDSDLPPEMRMIA